MIYGGNNFNYFSQNKLRVKLVHQPVTFFLQKFYSSFGFGTFFRARVKSLYVTDGQTDEQYLYCGVVGRSRKNMA